ncbi:MAG: hypothetical protein M1820_008814 [Bogoriella megaspora]|nr:MAG: hypothetical protein M1820_008814 [Bogoriella megaspora]
MRPDEIFDFDEMDYAARTSNHDTQHLRQQEIIKTRQVAKAHAGVYQGTIASAATGGAAFIAPVYAGRQGDVAEAKLKIIQMELTKRGVPLHTTNNDDYAAVALSTLVGGEVGDLADAGLPATLPDSSIQAVAAGMVSEETGGSAADGLLDPKMPPSCTRRSLKKYHRLRCDACSRWFDTSFTEYLRQSIPCYNRCVCCLVVDKLSRLLSMFW